MSDDVAKKIWDRALRVGRQNKLGAESQDFASWCVIKHLEGKLDPRTNLAHRFVDYMRFTYPDNPKTKISRGRVPKDDVHEPTDVDWCTGRHNQEDRTVTQQEFKSLLLESKLTHEETILMWLRFVHGFTPQDLNCMNDPGQARWFRDIMAVALEKVAATIARRNKCAE